jgi:hypothetical protein
MQANISGANTFVSTLSSIYHTEGFTALYQGVGPTVCRASVLAAVEMSMFETCKRIITEFALQNLPEGAPQKENLIITIAALAASFFSSLASSPFDVIRSRIMAQSKLKTKVEPSTSQPAPEKMTESVSTKGAVLSRRRNLHSTVEDSASTRRRSLSTPVVEEIYDGVVDCFVRSVRNDGVGVLWSGFWALYLRLGPNTVLTFLFIEFFRNVLSTLLKCR